MALSGRQARKAQTKTRALNRLYAGYCRISKIGVTTNLMSRHVTLVKEKVAAHRARQIAAGRVAVNTYLPGDLVARIDQIKEERGASSRAPIIEEALRLLIEKHTGA